MVEDTEAIASNGPEARLQAYKNAPQKTNSSSNYTYSNNENPEYQGKPAQPKPTAREVLSQRDQIQKTQQAYTQPTQQEVQDRYPLAKSFTLTDKNAKPIDLSEVSKNISPKLRAGFSLGNEDLSPNNGAVPITSGNIEDVYKKSISNKELGKENYFATEVTNTPQENEAVSFLKFPGIGQKTSTSEIPSTTILDPLQFIGIGAIGRDALSGVKFAGTLFKSEAKNLSKVGTKDIGLNTKSSKAYSDFTRFNQQTKLLPKPDSVKSPPPKPVPMTQQPIGLGKGVGKTLPKGSDYSGIISKPKSSPPPTPPPKETSAGKGLIQILRTQIKTKQTTKPQFEMQHALKQEQFLKRELKPKTKQISQIKHISKIVLITKQTQKTSQRQQQRQEQKQTFLGLLKQRQEQKQQSKQNNDSKYAGLIGKSGKQKQGQPHNSFVGLTGFIPTPPPPKTPSITTPPPTRKTPPNRPPPQKPKEPNFDILFNDNKKHKYKRLNPKGNRLNYIGNQPAGSIVGIYKRNDLSYGKVKANKLQNKDYSILTRGSIKLENKSNIVKKLSKSKKFRL